MSVLRENRLKTQGYSATGIVCGLQLRSDTSERRGSGKKSNPTEYFNFLGVSV
jgi:hypothetical protein